MTQFNVSFKNRLFYGQHLGGAVKTQVVSLRWSAVGGCDAAVIELRGPEADLWEAIDYLRYGVEISDEHGLDVWWGYVNEVVVGVGRWSIGSSLDRMYNKIAVAYSLAQTDKKTVGYRKTTSWVQDSDTVTEYGTKEFLSSQGSLSDAAAASRAADLLTQFKYPVGTCETFSGGAVATLVCLGWYHTLSWRYASVPAVTGMAYSTTSATEQAVGAASGNQQVMQVVNLGGRSINALGLSVYGRKQGSPADNLVLALYELDDDTDKPVGSALGTVTLAGGSVSGSLGWLTGTFASEASLDPQKDYGVRVSRSGAVDATNYYVVNVNTGLGDASGFFKIYNGSAWVDRSPDADMPYVISKNNYVESTQQIKELVRTFGEFITYVDVDEESGNPLPSYRDGDSLVSAELEALYKSGGANGRKLLTRVTPDRRLAVWEMPARTNIEYDLDRGMTFYDNGIGARRPYNPPVGVWCRLVDLIPGGIDASKLNHPEVQFVEAATWTNGSGLQPVFMGTPTPEQLFEVQR